MVEVFIDSVKVSFSDRRPPQDKMNKGKQLALTLIASRHSVIAATPPSKQAKRRALLFVRVHLDLDDDDDDGTHLHWRQFYQLFDVGFLRPVDYY